MCIEQRVTYACMHCQKLANPCPTYLKQQSSWLNRLFGTHQGEKNCGYVRRSMETCVNSCDRCAIQVDGMAIKRLGTGVSLVQRQFVDESFRKQGHDAARHALEKSERSSRSKKSGHHDVISSKNSVWVPEYYHHPKTATDTRYGRGYEPAPPVAPPRADGKLKKSSNKSCKWSSRDRSLHNKSSKERSRSKVREGYLTRGWEEHSRRHDAPGVLNVSASRTAAFIPTQNQPLRKPAEPAPVLKPRGFRSQGLTVPSPSFSLSTLPPRARPNLKYVSKLGYAGSSSLPMAGQRNDNPPSVSQAPYQGPRRMSPRPAPQPAPLPLYEAYLREQGALVGGSLPLGYFHPKDKPTPKIVKQEPRRTTLESFGRAIGIEVSMSPTKTSSDISFACGGARQVERYGHNYDRAT